MEIIKPKVELLPDVGTDHSTKSVYCAMINRVAKIARLCYRSEQPAVDPDKADDKDCEFAHSLYEKGHTSVFEHVRIDFRANMLIPSLGGSDTAKKIIHMDSDMERIYRDAETAFYGIICKYVNRTSLHKESVSVRVSDSESPLEHEPCFEFRIKNINLRELMEIFDALTMYIGNSVAKRYCGNKYGYTSFWTPSFHDDGTLIPDEVECVIMSLVVALWRAIYVKLSDRENDLPRKNIFETISNRQRFHRYFDTTKVSNGEEIRTRFNSVAKETILGIKSDVAYEKTLKSAMKYMTSHNIPYDEMKNIAISNTMMCYTFYIETNRGVLAELTRHRCLSPTVESTRYVNYSKTDKYGEMCFTDQISLYEPDENDSEDIVKKNRKKQRMILKMYAKEEKMYNKLIKNGFIPQEARNVLPNGLVSRMYVTGTLLEWLHFVKLRSDKSAHPDIRVIADQVKSYLS